MFVRAVQRNLEGSKFMRMVKIMDFSLRIMFIIGFWFVLGCIATYVGY